MALGFAPVSTDAPKAGASGARCVEWGVSTPGVVCRLDRWFGRARNLGGRFFFQCPCGLVGN